MSKSHVGMGFHVCPVCCVEHDEVVLIDTRLKPTLEHRNFAGWGMCAEHKAQIADGYVALVEVTNKPTGLDDAERTGQTAMVRSSAFNQIFPRLRIPDGKLAFVENGTIAMLQSFVEKHNGE